MQCSLKEGLMKDNVSRRRKWKIVYKEERNVTERFIYKSEDQGLPEYVQ